MKCPTASPVGVALLEEAPLCALPAIVTATPAAALPVSTRLAALEALSWLALRTGSSEAALRAAEHALVPRPRCPAACVASVAAPGHRPLRRRQPPMSG
jgi:hypothetical protein